MAAKVIDFFKPPEYENIERAQKARFLHIALLVSCGGYILLALVNLSANMPLAMSLFIAGGICFLCVPANRQGHYTPVAVLISSMLLATVTYSLMVGVGLKDAGLVAYPIFIILTSYLFKKRAVILTTLASIAAIMTVYYLIGKGIVHPNSVYSDQTQLEVLIVLLLAIGFLLWVVVENWERIVKSLQDTYDLTLSGWGQALEFRDHETQGHSQRVVETTMALAIRLGVPEPHLEHIRRGALLHDIGKMGIPDAILLKKETLSEADWEIIRKHPLYARKMLEVIPYLKTSLEIPYSHHERWDGSGYPQGLKKEGIPFAARIFSVVDVWDALTSNRPYRPAWPEAKVWEYIQSQSGRQFDPQVVDAFMEMMGMKKETARVSDRSSVLTE